MWVVKDGKATRRQVDLGVRTPGFVEVRSGVEAGEQVVVGGQERLAEGAPVKAKVVDRTRPRVQVDSGPAARMRSAARRDGVRTVQRLGRPIGAYLLGPPRSDAT